MRLLLILIFATCSSINVFAGKWHDSLWNLWLDESKHDSIRLNAFYLSVYSAEKAPKEYDEKMELTQDAFSIEYAKKDNKSLSQYYSLMAGFNYNNVGLDSTYKMRSLALKYAKKAQYKRSIAINQRLLAVFDMKTGELDSVESRLLIARRLCREQGLYPSLFIVYDELINYHFYFRGDRTKSIEYSNEALQLALKLENYYRCSKYCAAVAAFSAQAKDFKWSNKYYEKATYYAEKSGSFSLLWQIEMGKATNYQLLENYEKFGQKIRSIYKRDLIRNETIKTLTDAAYGDYLIHIREIDSAIALYDTLSIHYNEIKDLPSEAACVLKLGECYGIRGNNKKSLGYYKKALKISYKSGLDDRVNSYKGLSEAYRVLGQFELSLNYLHKYIEAKDSIDDLGATASIVKTQMLRKIEADSLVALQANLEQELNHEKELGKEKRNKNIFFGSAVLLV
ncbi:MAG: tetratricopeptide repeat protein, partial [Bacteroidia bacterium]